MPSFSCHAILCVYNFFSASLLFFLAIVICTEPYNTSSLLLSLLPPLSVSVSLSLSADFKPIPPHTTPILLHRHRARLLRVLARAEEHAFVALGLFVFAHAAGLFGSNFFLCVSLLVCWCVGWYDRVEGRERERA